MKGCFNMSFNPSKGVSWEKTLHFFFKKGQQFGSDGLNNVKHLNRVP